MQQVFAIFVILMALAVSVAIANAQPGYQHPGWNGYPQHYYGQNFGPHPYWDGYRWAPPPPAYYPPPPPRDCGFGIGPLHVFAPCLVQ